MTAMKQSVIAYNARVLVADARKALLLRNVGTASDLALEVEQVIEAPRAAPTRGQGTDRPGRTASGSHRSSLGQTDFHQLEEDRFSSMVAEKLEAICAGNDVHKLIVVAPPKALADLRRAMPETVRKRIVAEYDKDLVNLPVDEIEKHLAS
ncbi:host attachment protein [Rhizobium bangladeshense]|nr:host attachment protein [Rhizobium bangladeshense]MBX4898894.1 host attachment protein [Rhizobium bangladeshense]MBY3584173.1 host attachment protein [Rhizobium bangladeshense]MBY3616990.1 host attachment protein [Rhizobium bangladeshense]